MARDSSDVTPITPPAASAYSSFSIHEILRSPARARSCDRSASAKQFRSPRSEENFELRNASKAFRKNHFQFAFVRSLTAPSQTRVEDVGCVSPASAKARV